MRKKCRLCRKLPQLAVEMLSRIENDHNFPNHFIFLDEAAFHVRNKVNIITTAEFGAQKIPMQHRKWNETVQKSMCGLLLSHDAVIGPFSIAETFVTSNIYLDMLQIYGISQMQHLQPTVTFQQDAGSHMFEHFVGTGLPPGYPRGY
ncbi:hypothetical protein AVEN_2699-1 [Araneus ventricosus]|uniref:Tc1-like transposase DDE domain-containing protein n=1 Tax=Araneus ventricosus TaxID=182803 RepID=A0A4Y2JUJ1_ARAVE|nr:hypothetical protein AVEN_2699-1 [Araneus ventricosus]